MARRDMILLCPIMVILGGYTYYRGKTPQAHRDTPHKMSILLQITGLILMLLGLFGISLLFLMFLAFGSEL